MALSRTAFDIVSALASSRAQPPTQRSLAKQTGHSLGAVNAALAQLQEEGLVLGMRATDNALEKLEAYRVKRAVILAAGFGQRLIPITFKTPKPLVRIKGVRIIDTILDALSLAGIHDVTVVRGYLAEQFDILAQKHPGVKFIDNPDYINANNIASAYCARDLIAGAYVMEADLFIRNPGLITPWQYESNYLGVPVEKTDDWCFRTAGRNRITALTLGGTDCHHMFGISYWTAEDGRRLARDLEEVYAAPGGKEKFFDQVALQDRIADYALTVRPCSFDDIAEVDTMQDLCALDPTYASYVL